MHTHAASASARRRRFRMRGTRPQQSANTRPNFGRFKRIPIRCITYIDSIPPARARHLPEKTVETLSPAERGIRTSSIRLETRDVSQSPFHRRHGRSTSFREVRLRRCVANVVAGDVPSSCYSVSGSCRHATRSSARAMFLAAPAWVVASSTHWSDSSTFPGDRANSIDGDRICLHRSRSPTAAIVPAQFATANSLR